MVFFREAKVNNFRLTFVVEMEGEMNCVTLPQEMLFVSILGLNLRGLTVSVSITRVACSVTWNRFVTLFVFNFFVHLCFEVYL